MRKPRVLILAYTFPPENRVSSLRPYKMAKEFSRHGWDVSVLCSTSTGAQRDLDVETGWLSVFHYMPNLISRWFANDEQGQRSIFSGVLGVLKKIARRCIVPEHTWLLKRRVTRQALNLFRQDSYDCIVSISYPFVLHAVAHRLKKRFPQTIWICDNRDVWHGNPYRGKRYIFAALEKQIESRLMADADVVTFAAKSSEDIYRSRYRLKKTLTILNGYLDEQMINNNLMPKEFDASNINILHAGSLYGGRRDVVPLLDALDRIRLKVERKVVLFLYGDDGADSRLINDYKNRLDIRFMPKVARSKIYELQWSSDFLLVATGRSEFDQSFVPAKIFDYAATGKPVIAICEPSSDLGRIVQEYSLGVASFCSHTIENFIMSSLTSPHTAGDHINSRGTLSSHYQFGNLVKFVNDLIQHKISK